MQNSQNHNIVLYYPTLIVLCASMVLVCAYQVMFANIDINGAISGFYITVVTNALILIIFDVLFNWKKRSKYEHLFYSCYI
jgi:hypothetical protein